MNTHKKQEVGRSIAVPYVKDITYQSTTYLQNKTKYKIIHFI